MSGYLMFRCAFVTEYRPWRTDRSRTRIDEYDRHMAGEQDHSGRFDYLFEPLDVDMANTDVIVASAVEQADADDRRSRTAATRFGIAAVVVAMIAVAIATVLFVLQRPTPRLASTLRSAHCTAFFVAPIATIEPVVQSPPPVTASSVEPPHTTAVVVPQPQPQLQPEPQPEPEPAPQPLEPQPHLQPAPTISAPTTAASATERTPPSPTMRAPMSVEPEPHPPFPNQQRAGRQRPRRRRRTVGRPRRAFLVVRLDARL